MFVRSVRRLSQQLCVGAWRSAHCMYDPEWRAGPGSPYWIPSETLSFDDIPTVTEKYDPQKFYKVAEKWYEKHGYVVKELTPDGSCTVHLFHMQDFKTVYYNDGDYPIVPRHQIMTHYRQDRKHLYDHLGLQLGQGPEWRNLRFIASFDNVGFIHSDLLRQDVLNDLIKIVKDNVNDKGEIDLLPILHRWIFDCVGIVAFKRRFYAFSQTNKEMSDKLVEAAALTHKIIHLTTVDPETSYDERFKLLAEAQDFLYSVVRNCLDVFKKGPPPEPTCRSIAQILLESGKCSDKDVITVIMDMFHGAWQTVPLMALMSLYHVARHADVQAFLREDIMERMPEKGSIYTHAVMPAQKIRAETFRMTPPIIGTERITQKDLVLGGYFVPAHTNVFNHCQVYLRHELATEDPWVLNLRRKNLHITDFIYGGSGRKCFGKLLGSRMSSYVVTKMVKNFEVFYDGGEVNMINQLNYNIPEKPLILRLKPLEQ